MAPFINACDEVTSDQLLQEILLEEAQPLIANILRLKLQISSDNRRANHEKDYAEEVYGEVILKLVRRLQRLRADPDHSPVSNLRGYITTMTRNACDEYLRSRYPERHRLKNRLRYMLTHMPGLGLWESDDGEWVCGLAAWRGGPAIVRATWSLARFRDTLDAFMSEELAGSDPAQMDAGDLLAAVFDLVGRPFDFDDLVSIVAELLRVKDNPHVVNNAPGGEEGLSGLAFEPVPDLEGAIDRRRQLGRVWAEIRLLSERQRSALLLSLRDTKGRSALGLLPVAGIASIREIAEVLGLEAERLLQMWDELPLEDSKIGEQLGATPQQVVNLRKAARERLARRTDVQRRKGRN